MDAFTSVSGPALAPCIHAAHLATADFDEDARPALDGSPSAPPRLMSGGGPCVVTHVATLLCDPRTIPGEHSLPVVPDWLPRPVSQARTRHGCALAPCVVGSESALGFPSRLLHFCCPLPLPLCCP